MEMPMNDPCDHDMISGIGGRRRAIAEPATPPARAHPSPMARIVLEAHA
jgi:hypothetical protein